MIILNSREQQLSYCDKVIGGIAPDLKGLTKQCQSIVPPGRPDTIHFDLERLRWRRLPKRENLPAKILDLTKCLPSDDFPDGAA